MIPQSKWKWFGHAGHLCVGRWCRFHLCTQVGKYLVSTVGQYIPPHRTAGSERGEFEFLKAFPNGETIGCDRFYETMVFKAGKPCTSKGCGCGMPSIDGSDLDFAGYNDAGSATDGHMKMCLKWAKKA